jgi:carbonic anhydrase
MSIYSSSTSWGGQCSNSGQSPINLAESATKPCNLLCELVFDNAYIPQANVIVSDEGLVLHNDSGLGSCKYNGEGYTCKTVLVTHPSHHTVENIQADAEVVAIFTNPTGNYLCVSSLVRVNPNHTDSSHFFNSFVPYANPESKQTSISLGEQWGLFMMVPPAGSYFMYDGTMVTPPCINTKWVVFKAMINIDPNDFALLVKNVPAGSRPLQQVGDREIFFNDTETLQGGPMPRDGKVYIRFKKPVKRKEEGVVRTAGLSQAQSNQTTSGIHSWVKDQLQKNDLIQVVNFIITLIAIYIGWTNGKRIALNEPFPGVWLTLKFQALAAWIRGLFFKSQPDQG